MVILLALIGVAPHTAAAPLVPDALFGSAPATTFQIFGLGYSVEGGAFDLTDVCSHCWIRMTITGGNLAVVDATHPAGSVRTLAPGQYEIREFRGLFGLYNFGQHDFQIWLEGTGKTIKLS